MYFQLNRFLDWTLVTHVRDSYWTEFPFAFEVFIITVNILYKKIVKRFLLFLWVFQIFLNYNNCHKYNQPIYGIAKCVLYLFQIFVQLNVMLKKMRHIYFAREKVEFRDWSLEALADYLIQHEILWGSKSTKKLSDPSFRREKTERGG